MITHPGAMASAMTGMEPNFIMGVTTTNKYARHSMKHFGRTRRNVGYWYDAMFFAMLRSLLLEFGLLLKSRVIIPMFKSMMHQT